MLAVRGQPEVLVLVAAVLEVLDYHREIPMAAGAAVLALFLLLPEHLFNMQVAVVEVTMGMGVHSQ
jgi:hypothetical protein